MTVFGRSVFDKKTTHLIPQDSQVVFVSDLFVEDYVGGAELTTQALIDESPYLVHKIHSRDVTLETLESGASKFWIFGNFSQLNPQLIPTIIGNLKYSILEYDFKFCKHRSPEKHEAIEGIPCNCHDQLHGKLISAFYHGSKGMWWMSEKQKDVYTNRFPFLLEGNNTVLSSVFDKRTLGFLKHQRLTSTKNETWIVLGSTSWVKGLEAAKKWCEDEGIQYEVVWNIPYEQLLTKLAQSEGFVYLPAGGDTCPRMVIEAKLLGCELHVNENVLHKDEDWFATDDIDSISDYLFTSPKVFWNGIKAMIDQKPTISGYITTYNCVKQNYPFEQSIKSMLEFCDEVCVVDGGSSDETYDLLAMWALKEPKLVIRRIKRDWNNPRSAVFDGLQKAEARAMCTKEFCWQMDSDEIVHEDDGKKIIDLCANMPSTINLVSLPVVEYWGGSDKVRCDVTPWKWRLSRNLSNITHGIPIHLRRIDQLGNTYSALGSDGCDLIDKNTGHAIEHITFYTPDADAARQRALSGDVEALKQYEGWFNDAISQLPSVFHYSWFNIERKIHLYKNFWGRHWSSLYSPDPSKVTDVNMMFDVPWSEVTDEMIAAKAEELKNNTGGHVWHSKWTGQKTPWLTVNRSQPRFMNEEVNK